MSHGVVQATPANWPYNHDSIGKKGWAFLLPTVTPEDAKTHFPDHHSCKVCCHSVINLGRCGHASCQDCISYLTKGVLQGCVHLSFLLCGNTLAVTLVTMALQQLCISSQQVGGYFIVNSKVQSMDRPAVMVGPGSFVTACYKVLAPLAGQVC